MQKDYFILDIKCGNHSLHGEIAALQKGELIIKDQMAFALGMGSKYKKNNVTHII